MAKHKKNDAGQAAPAGAGVEAAPAAEKAAAQEAAPPRLLAFKEPHGAVRAEKNERVQLEAGRPYEVKELRETRAGSFAVALVDPEVTHDGGPDGLTPEPCTLWTQAAQGAFTVEGA